MATFRFDLVSPARLVFTGDVTQVDVPGVDGDFGVLLHTARSDNAGATWNTPVLIPPDGDSSTDYPFDLAVDSRGDLYVGEVAVTAWPSLFPDQPVPKPVRALQKFVKVPAGTTQ